MVCWLQPIKSLILRFCMTKLSLITNIHWKFEDFWSSSLRFIKYSPSESLFGCTTKNWIIGSFFTVKILVKWDEMKSTYIILLFLKCLKICCSQAITRPDFSDFFNWASRARSSKFDRAREENYEPVKNVLLNFTII